MNKLAANYFYIVLICIAVLGFALRLYHITYPIADWFSWRQADTAAVARNYVRFGIDPLHPRYDDLSNIQSGKDNPQGYRMVELPLYQVMGAGLKKVFPQLSIEVWLRLLTIAASVSTTVFVGLVVLEYTDPFSGLIASFVYAVLPYSIYYGRTILPDSQMVFWSVLSIWLVTRKRIFFGAVAGALALLSKPMAVFLLLPIPYITLRHFGVSRKLLLNTCIYAVISLLPFFLWRRWILQYPEGIPASSWLLNGNGIRFKGAWFHWLFATRLGDLILGFWGLIPLGIGLSRRATKKAGWTFRLLVLGVLMYFIVFATGNVQHDYYQILIIPVVAMLVGIGLRTMKPWFAVISVIFMISFSWFTIRTYYWINHPEIVEAGEVANQILPKDAKVIAPYNGDTSFLYQTKRKGWPLGFEIDKKIAMGATAYVTISPTDNDGETKDLASRYTVLVRNNTYAIIDLTHPKSLKALPGQ